MEVVTLFNDLESNNLNIFEESKKRFAEVFSSAKEPMFVYGMMDYFSHTNSVRAVDVLVKVQTPHDRFIMDRLSEWLRSGGNKQNALNLFGHIIMKHPTWLYKIGNHSFFKDILKLLKNEKELIPMMSALLCIVNLMPIIPSKISGCLPDLFEIFVHLADWNLKNPMKLSNDLLVHLQIGLYRYFHRLYGMFPCNFINFIRQEYIVKEKLAVFSHTIKPLLETVKMNPLLVTASGASELHSDRWKKMEPHDVVYECSKYSLDYLEKPEMNECACCHQHGGGSSSHPNSAPIGPNTFDFNSQSATTISMMSEKRFPFLSMPVSERFTDYSNYEAKIWSPSALVLATPPPTGTVPHTPTPTPSYSVNTTASSHHSIGTQDGSSPPEAAIEATPETTPMKEMAKTIRTLPNNSTAVRAIFGPTTTIVTASTGGASSPSPKKEPSPFRFPETVTGTIESHNTTKKLINIMNDRTQSIKYIEMATNSPTSPLPMAEQATRQEEETETVEIDSEVAITEFSTAIIGSPCSVGGLHLPDSRSVIKFRHRLRLYSNCVADNFEETNLAEEDVSPAAIKRARSLPNMLKSSSTRDDRPRNGTTAVLVQTSPPSPYVKSPEKVYKSDSSSQTVQQWPQYYEHMFLNMLNEETTKCKQVDVDLPHTPNAILKQYIAMSIKKKQANDSRNWEELYRDQTQLLTLQLQYERHRREVHAERNRRLLSKTRTNGELEQQNRTLLDQVNRLTAENSRINQQWNENRKKFNQREMDLLSQINSWKLKYQSELDDTRKLRDIIESLNAKLSEEQQQRKEQNVDKELVHGELFDLKNDLRQATYQADLGQQYRQELTRMQSEMILMGEIQLRCKERFNEIEVLKARDVEYEQLQFGYSEEVRELRSALEIKASQLETAKYRISELEKALSNRDSSLTDQKRLLKTVKEEYQEKFNALEKKYAAQKLIILRMEESIFELYKNQPGSVASPDSENADIVGSLDHASPLSLSLASSDLSASVHSEIKNLQPLVGSKSSNDCDTMVTSAATAGPSNIEARRSGRAGENIPVDIPVPPGTSHHHQHNKD